MVSLGLMTKSSMRSSRYLVSAGGEFGLREQYEKLLRSGGPDPKAVDLSESSLSGHFAQQLHLRQVAPEEKFEMVWK
jgi:hypothetical protein